MKGLWPENLRNMTSQILKMLLNLKPNPKGMDMVDPQEGAEIDLD
jgi:hypothetical protein